MKKFWSFLRSYLLEVCVIFTVLVLGICLVQAMSVDPGSSGLNIFGTLYLFLFSLFLSAANLLFRIRKPHIAFRVLLHFILVAGVLLFALGKLSNMEISLSTILLILAALAAVYIIGCIIAALIASRRKKAEESRSDYQPMFGKTRSSERASQSPERSGKKGK